MELWSKGLGNMTLTTDLTEYAVSSESDSVVLSGTVHNRLLWKSKITFFKDDMPGLLNFAFSIIFSGAFLSLFSGPGKEESQR